MGNKGISERVGRAADSSSTTTTRHGVVYRALRGLVCTKCGTVIGEGELFVRRPLGDSQLPLLMLCRGCAPVSLPHSEDAAGESLLQAVLTPGPQQARSPHEARQPHTGTVCSTVDLHTKPAAEAEVERRLGPALARCRSTRHQGR